MLKAGDVPRNDNNQAAERGNATESAVLNEDFGTHNQKLLEDRSPKTGTNSEMSLLRSM